MNQKTVIPLYKEICVQCTHMNPRATKTFKCHYSKGNDLCPAKSFVFSVGFSAELFATRYQAAMEDGDIAKMRNILEKASEQPQGVQREFFDRVGELVAAQYTVEMIDSSTSTPSVTDTENPGVNTSTLQDAAEDDDGSWES